MPAGGRSVESDRTMQVKRIKRPVNGVLLLDKPHGISSNAALQQVKRLYAAAKAGHTGNLDPIATGMLPICLGEATKFSQYLLDSDKAYQAVFQLGRTTTTGDTEGEVVTEQPVQVQRADIEAVLPRFLGEQAQVPPMYSALKHQGRALYEYARQGVEIDRAARLIRIHALTLDAYDAQAHTLAVTVHCSKGTYIRVLGEDIGQALGCGAHMTALRRIRAGRFQLAEAVTLPQLEALASAARDALLQPPDILVADWPQLVLDAQQARSVLQGQGIRCVAPGVAGLVRLYNAQREFLGAGEVSAAGDLAPRRLLAASAVAAAQRPD